MKRHDFLFDDSPAGASYFEVLPGNIALDFGGGPDYGAAAAAQSAAAERTAGIYQQMYQQARSDEMPFMQLGWNTAPYYGGILGIPGYDRVDPTEALRATPGYQFTLNQGTDALSRYAAARGLSMSPATLKGIQSFGQGTADQTYNSYMNRLAGNLNLGQGAAGQTGAFGMNAAGGMGQAYMTEGEAQANAILAQGLQRQSGFGSIGSLLGMGAGILAAPFTGGTSLYGSLASGIGGLFNGGGGAPSYEMGGYGLGNFGYA